MMLLAVCSKLSLKADGEECFAASECGDGLVCDFSVTPAICAPGTGTTVIDAAPPDADRTDAVVRYDADPTQPDASPDPPDAALPDAAGDGDGDGDGD